MDDPWYLGKFWGGGHDHFSSILCVYLIFHPIIEILTRNFQDIFLGVYPRNQDVMDDPWYLGKF